MAKDKDDLLGNREYVDELLRQAKKADKEDRALAASMAVLVNRPEFHVYLERLLGPRIAMFGEQLLAPAGSQDGLVRGEFVKGALFGLCLARDLPSVIIAAMSEVRSQEESNA